MKNKFMFFLTAGIFLFAALNFISAQQSIEYPQCCPLTNNGAQCVAVPQSECAGNFAPTSCDQVPSCKKGVCVNIETGECTENTPRTVCEGDGGTFKDQPIHQIPECQKGCCILGQDTLFSTEVACKEAASKEGLDYTFREDIKTQASCLGLSLTEEEGACVVKTEFETKCKRTTGKECTSKEAGGFSGLLEKYVSGTSITAEFHQGLLCTADELKTDCTKSQKTTCFKDDVYYLDTCGNRANVFNSAKYNDPLTSDYWTYVQEPSEVCNAVVGGGNAAKTCGNCDYYSSSKCRSPQAGDPSPTNQMANFKNVCGDLKCNFKGKTYENTESWCAATPGTPWEEGGPGIKVNLDGSYAVSKDELFDPMKYNLPGSEYAYYECYEGEAIPVPCKGEREQVCKQYDIGGKSKAVCEVNNPRSCYSNQTKNACDALPDCYWLTGNSEIISGNEDEGATILSVLPKEEAEAQGLNLGKYPDNERQQKQGSCMPLFAPGKKFWTEEGQNYCAAANDIPREILYEIQLFQDRDKFAEDSGKINEKWSYTGDEGGKFNRQTRCGRNCFAIPNFGKDSLATIVALWNGEKASDWNSGDPISDRKGQYCHKKDKPDKLKSGQVIGSKVSCADEEDEGRRFNKPEFYTHNTWLKFIGIRARAAGDCGITTNAVGDEPSYDTEKITTIIQKVKQDTTSTKEKWKGETIKGILYKGEDLKDLNEPKFNGAIYPETLEKV